VQKFADQKSVYLSTVPMPAEILQMIWTAFGFGKKVRFAATGLRSARKKRKNLIFLKEMIEAGKFKAVIDQIYPMKEIMVFLS
jgi:hypothetical protein